MSHFWEAVGQFVRYCRMLYHKSHGPMSYSLDGHFSVLSWVPFSGRLRMGVSLSVRCGRGLSVREHWIPALRSVKQMVEVPSTM